MKVLSDRLVELSCCEGAMEIGEGVEERFVGFMMNGEISGGVGEEKMLEKGCNEVLEYEKRWLDEDEDGSEELIEKFKKMIERRCEEEERDIECVMIWGVEYDVSVSVLLSMNE